MSSICAIATPQAPSALGILRCSGALSSSVFLELLPRQAAVRQYISCEGVRLDEIVAVFYKGPHSFTGEDSLEITCHGNPFILQKILADLLARGFVLAAPGEFTRRAFMNGRIDLTQAEAIGSLIAAHSERALAAAHRQLAGELGRSIKGFSESLLILIAQVEATIDFPEEDVPAHLPPVADFVTLIEKLSVLRSTRHAHHLTFDGARVAIVGSPNAGKSSLFNALLGRDRALVSPIAGTTRDYIEASVNLGGHLVTLIDTAGLNEISRPVPTPVAVQSHEEIENLGMQKTRDQLATADIVIFVIDGADPTFTLPDFDLKPFATLVVASKSDLPSFRLPAFFPQTISGYVIPQDPAPIAVSTKTLAGIEGLKTALIEKLLALMPSADTLMVSARHAAALDEVLSQLTLGRDLLSKNSEVPLIAHHLHCALNYLGEILGKFDNEEVLDKLFSRFCIGK